MKQSIHPIYYNNAKVTCACGAKFETGSTEPEMRVEICSMCHPYYTGTQKLIDTAGRVDRFKARLEKAQQFKKPKSEKATPDMPDASRGGRAKNEKGDK